MTIDDKSPPGSWKAEMERMPWKYSQQEKVGWALSEMRLRGMFKEADILSQEIVVLKAEVERLRADRT